MDVTIASATQRRNRRARRRRRGSAAARSADHWTDAERATASACHAIVPAGAGPARAGRGGPVLDRDDGSEPVKRSIAIRTRYTATSVMVGVMSGREAGARPRPRPVWILALIRWADRRFPPRPSRAPEACLNDVVTMGVPRRATWR